jgi:hypothetical protein
VIILKDGGQKGHIVFILGKNIVKYICIYRDMPYMEEDWLKSEIQNGHQEVFSAHFSQ